MYPDRCVTYVPGLDYLCRHVGQRGAVLVTLGTRAMAGALACAARRTRPFLSLVHLD
jgi:hypothetical protein